VLPPGGGWTVPPLPPLPCWANPVCPNRASDPGTQVALAGGDPATTPPAPPPALAPFDPASLVDPGTEFTVPPVGADEAAVEEATTGPSAVDAGAQAAAGSALGQLAATGEVDPGAALASGARAAAGAVVTDALVEASIGSTVASAAGSFLDGLLAGGDVGDLAAQAGVDVAAGNLVQVFGPLSAPVIGPLLGLFASDLTGSPLPGPGSIVGGVLGAAVGGPLGSLAGGLVGGILDGALGLSGSNRFDIAEVDVSGDGVPDLVQGLNGEDDYLYTVTTGADQLPLAQVGYQVFQREVYVDRNHDDLGNVTSTSYEQPRWDDDSGVREGETKYFLDASFVFAPLHPGTDAPVVDVGDHANFYDAEGHPEMVDLVELTAEEYHALTAGLGTPGGVLTAGDPRIELLRPQLAGTGGVTFRQAEKTAGIHYRYDVDADGVPDLFRYLPDIEGFVDGDGSRQLVQLGAPA
jgi:hypothetical protein